MTALGGAERIGPFVVDDRPIFFDFWHEARRFEISETGATAPAFVLSSARRPRFSRAGTKTLDIQKGTVWVRGDLVDGSLPAGAYVGITVSDGKLRLPHVVASTDQSVEIGSPVKAKLELVLSADNVAAVDGGCDSGVVLELPSLSLAFGPAGLEIQGGAGAATVLGHEFTFAGTTGALTFVPQVWMLLVGYEVQPDSFDAGLINSNLADFAGMAAVKAAALALPVVVAAPAALSPAAVSPGFWVELSGVQARWYAPDERFHGFDPWMMLTNRAAALLDFDVPPPATPVKTKYRQWELSGTEGKRLPWRQDYDRPFLFYWVCDLLNGESLLASGKARVAVDRPVQANGRPVPTPTGMGALLLRSTPGGVRATLATTVEDGKDLQLVLRNALVWATQATTIWADGPLTDRQQFDEGSLLLRFGIYGWSPTLPDPYVGNFHICKPSFDRSRGLLGAMLRWTTPSSPELLFLGDLGLPVVCANLRSPGDPRPAPRSRDNPDAGLTQTEQGRLYLTRKQQAVLRKAQAAERELRAGRAARADRLNKQSQTIFERQLVERLGQTPPVFLLDVSTNQDLLGVALWGVAARDTHFGTPATTTNVAGAGSFPVQALDVTSPVEALRLVTLPQVQWEPVRTLDGDQDVLTTWWEFRFTGHL